METVILITAAASLLLSLVILVLLMRSQSELRQEINNNINNNIKTLGDGLKESQRLSGDIQTKEIEALRRELNKLREDNNRQLAEIRGTVDIKLQETLDKKINESFKTVNESLKAVYNGLGEMQSLAKGVGDLKNVLSNVKKRGIFGEIQLGAILSDILAPGQYEENVITVPGSKNRVEFAVRLPGGGDGDTILLPIDSKFNSDKYTMLQAAYETGDKKQIDKARKELEAAIKKNAKDISEKYISPPDTTEFGIMFIPFEGLYAETVNSGLVDDIQREYHISIAGPSTMSAILNALQMGFRTLAIEKRSHEIWDILGEIKKEFGTFADVLKETQTNLENTQESLEKLVGVRTRQMNRQLRKLETLDNGEGGDHLSV